MRMSARCATLVLLATSALPAACEKNSSVGGAAGGEKAATGKASLELAKTPEFDGAQDFAGARRDFILRPEGRIMSVDGSKIDLVRFFTLIDKVPGTFQGVTKQVARPPPSAPRCSTMRAKSRRRPDSGRRGRRRRGRQRCGFRAAWSGVRPTSTPDRPRLRCLGILHAGGQPSGARVAVQGSGIT